MAEQINDSMNSHFDQTRHIRIRRMEDILEGLTEPDIPPKFSWKSFDQGGTAVMIFNWVMVANIVMILFCIIYKRASSDDTYISRHHPTIDQQKEEAKRRRKIFKLYYSENIQQVRFPILNVLVCNKCQDTRYSRIGFRYTSSENIPRTN